MANFDMAELALKSVCPNNAMKYDDKEMPSVMVFIPKFRLCDVLSTADTSVHPAFRVNGVEIDGFWVGKYQTSHYNGNENTNGMIRRRFPKGTNFAAVTNAQIAQAENWINNYPRKILGYKSSEIVFRECLRELGIAA